MRSMKKITIYTCTERQQHVMIRNCKVLIVSALLMPSGLWFESANFRVINVFPLWACFRLQIYDKKSNLTPFFTMFFFSLTLLLIHVISNQKVCFLRFAMKHCWVTFACCSSMFIFYYKNRWQIMVFRIIMFIFALGIKWDHNIIKWKSIWGESLLLL